uniref:uroporphyrinogen-III C-methyltransferase n=1 Tax=Chromera velia CCMP2878 TaxID=1169474 RepID=A0A0G4I9I5_9ALVE|mmetsp:Transcript_52564/g.102807  ORF Transcript_52564/g.102807 Transcript_52564/m.102807 type:complete len:296 (-) Transcript_52564:69-956(-)|eukprot:Cvel_12158.t1-p1 / transcript=Cvel_12158.t1 / gene=Cvel_12158 / organism=Chromera_velia_CCMP2878 / gene_product=Uroporphyrinogen-III C-methyltransferase, putative / transcript_product=Uroporphyrinogen-III C-methyltransferase, putative / location=Cvel_scaffold784:33347-36402(+) / protein_length=295 / sequence_SO=supercontig / SO=protein_coding / is_pseudo=false
MFSTSPSTTNLLLAGAGAAVGFAAAALLLDRLRSRERCGSVPPFPSLKKGTVYLVGAGPAGPELMTLWAYGCVRQADVLVVDDLVDSRIGELRRPECEVMGVPKRGGKADSTPQAEIDQILVREAKKGKSVVRLKGGDPLVFGRVWSEVKSLREAKVPFVLVPGVSSALSAPAAATIPLTEKELSASMLLLSGHSADAIDYECAARADTVVLLMAAKSFPSIAARLEAAGASPDTPVAAIKSAYLPEEQRVLRSTLGSWTATVEAAGLGGRLLSPCVIVVGKVAAFAEDTMQKQT